MFGVIDVVIIILVINFKISFEQGQPGVVLVGDKFDIVNKGHSRAAAWQHQAQDFQFFAVIALMGLGLHG